MADKKRPRVSDKVYIGTDGKEYGRAGDVPDGNVDRVELRFFDGPIDENGKPTTSTVVGVYVGSVPGIHSKLTGIARVALAHGLAQKIGDAYASLGSDLPSAIEAAEGMANRILAGEWFTEREGGSARGDTIFREAMIVVLSRLGKDMSEETETGQQNLALVDEIMADKERAKSWKARNDVKAEMEDIKIRRAQERRDKAVQAATESPETDGLDEFA